MKLIRLVLITVSALFFSSLYSQDFFIKGGVNFSGADVTVGSIHKYASLSDRIGPQWGMSYVQPFGRFVSLDIGTYSTTRGFYLRGRSTQFETQYVKTFLLNKDLSTQLALNIPFQNGKVFIAGGPYCSLGQLGISKQKDIAVMTEFYYSTTLFCTVFDFLWSYNDVSYDVGSVFSAGVEYGRFQLAVSYWNGMVNAYPQIHLGSDPVFAKNRTFGITMGYRMNYREK